MGSSAPLRPDGAPGMPYFYLFAVAAVLARAHVLYYIKCRQGDAATTADAIRCVPASRRGRLVLARACVCVTRLRHRRSPDRRAPQP